MVTQVSNEWMEWSHRASVGGHPRQKEKVTPSTTGGWPQAWDALITAAAVRDQRQKLRRLLVFFFFLDWQIYICNIFVSLLAFARCLNPASSARFDLCSTFWVYFVVEKCLTFQFFFFPDFSLSKQESPHLNIWWVQKILNHHFRSSLASADLHLQHFGSQTSAAVV